MDEGGQPEVEQEGGENRMSTRREMEKRWRGGAEGVRREEGGEGAGEEEGGYCWWMGDPPGVGRQDGWRRVEFSVSRVRSPASYIC